MIYVKSALIGLAACIAGTLPLVMILFTLLSFFSPRTLSPIPGPGEAAGVSWDLRSLLQGSFFPTWVFWGMELLIFIAGFNWQFRRMARRVG